MRKAILLVLLTTAGCMTSSKMNKVMDSWVGNNVNSLMASWGPPNQILDGENGGKIYCYGSTTMVTTGGGMVPTAQYSTSTTGTGHHVTSPTRTSYSRMPTYSRPVTKTRMFWVDSGGTIYNWSWQGL